jgi:hypothetical protein
VGPRHGLDAVAKRKIPSTCRKLNPIVFGEVKKIIVQ